MNEPLRIFIGYDRQEPLTFAVLAHSLLRHASVPLTITPLTRTSLSRLYTRPRGPKEATEFSMTRFLVPFLSDYSGYSLFMDCDMVCRVDIIDVMLHVVAQPGKAVYCCQHDYTPSSTIKFNYQMQTVYPKKNWSSFVIFDNAKCTALTPAYVNTATGLDLHRFHWLENDAVIGSLPLTWNWLIGEYPKNDTAQVLHYTLGSPCFTEYRDCDHADVWWDEYVALMTPMAATAAAMVAR